MIPIPPIRGIVETAIGVADIDRAAAFYINVLGLERMVGDERFCAFNAGPGHVLLLFRHGASEHDMQHPGGRIPGHGSSGQHHYAFAVESESELEEWARHLESCGVPVESEMRWAPSVRSIYFRDPDGNLGEFATPGLWPNF